MSTSSPLFSVCIPVYNGEKFIRAAIDSVLAQTFTDWELVVVDDASTDKTWEILQEYQSHPNIHLGRNERNSGVGHTCNQCLKFTSGHWMALLAADDAYLPHALEIMHREISKRPKMAVWIHAQLCHGMDREPSIPRVFTQPREMRAQEFAERLYLRGGCFGVMSSFACDLDCYRKTCTHLFWENTPHTDGDFWMRLMLQNLNRTAFYTPEVLVKVLIHNNSLSLSEEAAGREITEIFNATANSATAPWRRTVQLRQFARMIWVWLKYFHRIPRNRKDCLIRPCQILLREITRF